MLHTLTESGHMMWTCPCGTDLMAHISNPDVQHPSSDEMETVVEGTHVDEQGRTWTRYINRPTGNKITYSGSIGLPPCDCGKQTFLIVPTDQDIEQHAAMFTADGIPTNASIEALNRTKKLAQQLANAGKGPTT
jgi:hypothetical protein